MQFHTPWTTYSETQMDRHETGEPLQPIIYTSQDQTCVFVQTCDEAGHITLHRAEESEVEELWDRLRIEDLLMVLKMVGSHLAEVRYPELSESIDI